MALFSAVFSMHQLPKECSVLFLRRYISTSEGVFPRHPSKLAILQKARHQHTNSAQKERDVQMQQLLDGLDKVKMPSKPLSTSQLPQPLSTSQLQIVQLSEKLVQLALTATNLVRDLLEQNRPIGAQIQQPTQSDQMSAAKTVSSQKMDGEGIKERDKSEMEKAKEPYWICQKCYFRNSMMHFECKGCEEGRPMEFQWKELRLVWQCVNCKKLNGRRNKVCYECGNETPLKRENGTAPKWICEKCHFRNSMMHFECKGCEEGRPKESQRLEIRRFLEGIWKCVNCKTINGRRNIKCSKCGNGRSLRGEKVTQTDNGNPTGRDFAESQMENRANLSRVEMNSKKRGEKWGERVSQRADEKDWNISQPQNSANNVQDRKGWEQQQTDNDKHTLGQMFFGDPAEEKQAMAKK